MVPGSLAAGVQSLVYGGGAAGLDVGAKIVLVAVGTKIVLGAVGGSVAGYATPNCGTPSNCDNCN